MTPRIDALLGRIAERHPPQIELGLGRTHALLAALGNPHLSLPPVVHIAGTNGKGSTLSMVRAGLEGAGLKVHAYTSPHLVRFSERIVLAGEEIEEDRLASALEAVLAAGLPATYFEAITCAAFRAFADVPADMLLLEVGMGGTGDTTNVVDAPALTIITPVAMDHERFLGDTLAKIAGEKAGILKRAVPAIVGPQEDEALEVIEARAARLGAPLFAHGQHWHVGVEHGRLVYQDETGLLDLPLPALAGPHQVANAGTALAALRALGRDAGADAAMTNARWPARMQRLRSGALTDLASEAELWLDGGHNPHAAAALAATLDTLPRRTTHLVIAQLADRDPAAFLAPLAPHVASVTAIPIPNEDKAHAPETLAAAARTFGLSASTADTAEDAVARIATRDPAARIVICGSLYLAGAILSRTA
ncbi:folylpolyglutamate synthase/dihydrofolate synthase family protein [Tropicimonas sp. IMCC34011]|uniref:bifunctional folylpolyglutamate synthase/dihydrofolate synthase n=1 Tax=Tropicimonas sp. IMCC34011 TaxID=2248759 RepID=UPI000E255866|nr:folylpolyglutamate synthase/dihydrofolate synthase family protein [Tropicimonas sp. IMCC34011]